MRIAAIECQHADAGRRNFDFLKITTDDGTRTTGAKRLASEGS